MGDEKSQISLMPSVPVRLSMENVERIHTWRAQYIVLYLVWLVAQVYMRYGIGEEGGPNYYVGVPATVVLILFYVRFWGVLRVIGYPWIMCFGACLLALLVIPGVLVVGFIDRSLAKAVRKGLDARDAALAELAANERGADEGG